jgi:phage terminase large subunit-like protein
VGFAAFTFEQVTQVTEQLKVADERLYEAKTRRRQNVIRYAPEDKNLGAVEK